MSPLQGEFTLHSVEVPDIEAVLLADGRWHVADGIVKTRYERQFQVRYGDITGMVLYWMEDAHIYFVPFPQILGVRRRT